MYVFGVSSAVDDEYQQHVGGEDPDGEEEDDEGLDDVAGTQVGEEAQLHESGVRAAAVVQNRGHQNRVLLMHFHRNCFMWQRDGSKRMRVSRFKQLSRPWRSFLRLLVATWCSSGPTSSPASIVLVSPC